MSAPFPVNESARLRALHEYAVLDSGAEQAFDDIARLAAFVCKTPISLVSLIDADRQWFKAKVGLEVSETPREHAFCAHAILQPSETMIVPDAAQDARFAANPLVTGAPHIRFYMGVPLVTPTGEALGTLCVIDRAPRRLDTEQMEVLSALARQVVSQLELRRSLKTLEDSIAEHERHAERMDEYQRAMEQTQAALESESATDGLTGLKNRRSFDERLQEELSAALRSGTPLALALLDVDRFKAYNDSFGHPAGDEVLRSVAAILRQCARPYDVVARYGGEEFAVILPRASREGALVVAERIRRSMQRAVWPQRAVTVSIGVAMLGADTASAAALIECADKALYGSKENGRNRVTLAGAAGSNRT